MAHSTLLDRQYLENGYTYRITGRSRKKLKVALLGLIAAVS